MSFTATKVRCPVCHCRIEVDKSSGDKSYEGDKQLLLYREPDGTPATCCVTCFDKIQRSYAHLVRNIRWEYDQERKYKKLAQEKTEIARSEAVEECEKVS